MSFFGCVIASFVRLPPAEIGPKLHFTPYINQAKASVTYSLSAFKPLRLHLSLFMKLRFSFIYLKVFIKASVNVIKKLKFSFNVLSHLG